MKGLVCSAFFPHLLTSQVQMQIKYKTRLNACILGLNVLPDLASAPQLRHCCADKNYTIKAATLLLHITQLAVPLLVSTNILFFPFFIKHPTISIFF